MGDGLSRPLVCGRCLLCITTNAGCECGLTDIDVEPEQDACIDYIDNGEDDEQ